MNRNYKVGQKVSFWFGSDLESGNYGDQKKMGFNRIRTCTILEINPTDTSELLLQIEGCSNPVWSQEIDTY